MDVSSCFEEEIHALPLAAVRCLMHCRCSPSVHHVHVDLVQIISTIQFASLGEHDLQEPCGSCPGLILTILASHKLVADESGQGVVAFTVMVIEVDTSRNKEREQVCDWVSSYFSMRVQPGKRM